MFFYSHESSCIVARASAFLDVKRRNHIALQMELLKKNEARKDAFFERLFLLYSPLLSSETRKLNSRRDSDGYSIYRTPLMATFARHSRVLLDLTRKGKVFLYRESCYLVLDPHCAPPRVFFMSQRRRRYTWHTAVGLSKIQRLRALHDSPSELCTENAIFPSSLAVLWIFSRGLDLG